MHSGQSQVSLVSRPHLSRPPEKVISKYWNQNDIGSYSLGTRLIMSDCTGSNRGIPNQLMRRNNHIAQINPSLLPSSDDAVQLYKQFGGNITQFSAFGQDPFNSRPDLVQQLEIEFYQRYPQFGPFS